MVLNEEELRKAQELMLILLKKFAKICDDNDIHYFLDSGTLLGAIRHNGFIPWDDDIDVGMLRKDYDKFCQVLMTYKDENIVLQNFETDSGFGFSFSKLVLKNTKWIEKFAMNTNRDYEGIFLDIFPFDKVPNDDKQIRKIYKINNFYKAILFAKLGYNPGIKKPFKRFLFALLKFFSKFFSVKALQNKQVKLCTKYNYLENNYLVTEFGGTFYESLNPESFYKETCKHRFEDDYFNIPKQYDRVLTHMYGDYMTPPVDPTYKHEILEFDMGNYI